MGMRGITPELQQMAWPILDNLDNRPDWDWGDFDIDGDGKLDSVVLIHSGYGAETTTPDCHGRDYMDRIWAHGEFWNQITESGCKGSSQRNLIMHSKPTVVREILGSQRTILSG